MHITRVHIEGFKRFGTFDIDLNPTFNVIVGDNETGKTSILEAIGLVLTGRHEGNLIRYAVDPYFFNATEVAEFFATRRNGKQASPPKVLIEAYIDSADNDEGPALAKLKGANNTRSEHCPGLKLEIEVDPEHVEDLADYAAEQSNPSLLPIEYYRVTWRSFASSSVQGRNLPLRATTIDTALARAYRGPNKYLSKLVDDVLVDDQRHQLSLAYKKLRHAFSQEPGVTAINDYLKTQGNPVTEKKLTVEMDMSSRSTWDTAITAHLDDLPFDCAGKGEQCRLQLRLAIVAAEKSRVLLIEEPENHLSHSNLNMLMDDIRKDCEDRQVILATHSAFVLNKLGIDNLRLLSHSALTAMKLSGLKGDTNEYFAKLPGYDTLRLILSKRSILVEGPSDELIVQRAYKDKHGKLPLENRVDVISVGLAFKRFLDIAVILNLDTRVVTDNDGCVTALQKKYADYQGQSNIKVCYDKDESLGTLEPQLLKANSLEVLNRILGTTCADNAALLKHMDGNKTDCALKLLNTSETWHTPKYIADAIE